MTLPCAMSRCDFAESLSGVKGLKDLATQQLQELAEGASAMPTF